MAYSLKHINELAKNDPKAFVEGTEAEFQRKLELAAKRIAGNRDKSHIILLSGPSGSGKTTTAMKIEKLLDESGVETHTISMDNYFNTIDPETAPRNREGAIDYESPFCLDIDLLNRHFAMLDRGETIHIPKYEFARQMRSDILSQPLRLGKDELAIFEGIHALNDVIIGKNPQAFKLYIAARSNVVDEDGSVVFYHHWLRLCRRIVRDYKFRGSDAEFTLKMWPNVRRGEKLYISPYKENADLKFDSSLATEVCVMKPYVVPLLQELPRGQYPDADAILAAYDRIEALDESLIPADSLIREFIGKAAAERKGHRLLRRRQGRGGRGRHRAGRLRRRGEGLGLPGPPPPGAGDPIPPAGGQAAAPGRGRHALRHPPRQAQRL